MADQNDNDIDELVADRLRKAGLKFATEKAIGGLAPDFIVYAPDGRQFIVETRLWDFPGKPAKRAGRRSITRTRPKSTAHSW